MYLKKFVLIVLNYYLKIFIKLSFNLPNSQPKKADAGRQEVADLATRLPDLKRALWHLLWFSTGFQKHLFGLVVW